MDSGLSEKHVVVRRSVRRFCEAELRPIAKEIAAALGDNVAATRPPVLKHWAEGERRIGQTGNTVRPCPGIRQTYPQLFRTRP